MRTYLLAGTALMFMSGVALAQTSAGTNSSTGTSSQMAPQNQAGTNISKDSTTGNAGSTASGMQSGDHTMPQQRRSTMSNGMKHGSGRQSSMNSGGMGQGSMRGNNTRYVSHRMGGGMPSNASAGQYLHIAQTAVMAHNKMRAHDALGRAETDLLTNSYVQGSVNGPISTPAISDIRGARRAVDQGQFHQASMMIHKVMTDMHGQMGNGQMGNGQRSGMMDHDHNSGMMDHGQSSGMMTNSGNTGMNSTGMNSTGMNSTGMNSNTKSDGGTMMPGAKPQAKQNSSMHNQMTKTTNTAQ